MGRTQRSNNNASCQVNELSGSIGGTHTDLERSRRGDRLPLEGFDLGTRDLDLEVRQRHFERRGQQQGR